VLLRLYIFEMSNDAEHERESWDLARNLITQAINTVHNGRRPTPSLQSSASSSSAPSHSRPTGTMSSRPTRSNVLVHGVSSMTAPAESRRTSTSNQQSSSASSASKMEGSTYNEHKRLFSPYLQAFNDKKKKSKFRQPVWSKDVIQLSTFMFSKRRSFSTRENNISKNEFRSKKDNL
jgi:hypothetical protein